MPRSDRVRVAAAQISGVAAGVVQVKRVIEEEALAEVRAVLARLPKAERQRALDAAIKIYVRPARVGRGCGTPPRRGFSSGQARGGRIDRGARPAVIHALPSIL